MKSFEHPIDRIEERCDRVLNLVPAFDERYIRDETDWAKSLYPELKKFLLEAAHDGGGVRLVLDAHASLAFAAGSVLNVKSGRRVELEQRTMGRHVWAADDRPSDPNWPRLVSTLAELDGAHPDLIVAIGLTHNVAADVQAYIDRTALGAGRLLTLLPSTSPGAQSVTSGRHAFELAQQVVEAIRAVCRTTSGGTIHLFIAAPNAFTFFLGQHQPLIGPTRLYEFDFDGGRDRSYAPALLLPVAASAIA